MTTTTITTIENKNALPSTLQDKAREFIEASISAETRRAYKRHFENFMRFVGHDVVPSTADEIAAFIVDMAENGQSVSNITQAVAALKKAHELAAPNTPSPTDNPIVKTMLRGLRRKLGTAPVKKTALTLDMLDTVIGSIDRNTLAGKRDAALLLVGFAGAFRRSELSALNVDDIEKTTGKNGKPVLIVTVRRSKTDQEGKGMIKAIFGNRNKSMCPITALQDWLDAAGISDGALFRRVTKGDTLINARISGESIASIVKRAAKRAGLDDSLDFAGHSLRSGFVTTAVNSGAGEWQIMNQTGHKSSTVLRGYIHRNSVINDNAAALIFND